LRISRSLVKSKEKIGYPGAVHRVAEQHIAPNESKMATADESASLAVEVVEIIL